MTARAFLWAHSGADRTDMMDRTNGQIVVTYLSVYDSFSLVGTHVPLYGLGETFSNTVSWGIAKKALCF